ncbi:hypothetical protein EHQ68_04565 [Leptospira congkakensis]|uniref:Uncharacterized protein n=1 Tax=Leptospira congkakensis TaxID=2484932 RepID=A0A4Z1A7P8_9LEPT|nr:hypothetical protein [Leptospira congkakensis]TGL90703.1 hypothetical protein EHQ69_12325 [Leptospira congkakensis]TGL91710.1 hypothetical protein EHQ68_04565 [Leptospira congkakensis]TGL98762.1 hypothetical protein EHQ70_04150 [Leptospira congkakensis]
MKKLVLLIIQISLLIHCINLGNLNGQKWENKSLKQATVSLLITTEYLGNYISGLPVNNMFFRYSVIDTQNKTLSLSNYCVNVYTLVGLDPNKIITEWQSLTKNPAKCILNDPMDFKCVSSSIIYVNEFILPAYMGITNAKNLCINEAKGTILVY